MRVRGVDWMVKVEPGDFDILCTCAIRYCFGRQTYMPSMVQDIVLQHLHEIRDGDLKILLEDCDSQQKKQLYGDPTIDKPGWIRYRERLTEEAKRRKLL